MRKLILAAAAALVLHSGMALAAGAIAVDDEEGVSASEVGYGVGTGSTRDEAGADAMRECKKAGNKGCKVAVRYDTCGAYAGSRSSYAIGYGKTESAAKSMALDACGSGCKIVVADCDN
ncbi:conserved exported hypothetical protein [Rhodospirillaceae bacterium LM-1]|nr:conserved exported hypothetical protein [Rhodospirillaceae bacterium LM-1]